MSQIIVLLLSLFFVDLPHHGQSFDGVLQYMEINMSIQIMARFGTRQHTDVKRGYSTYIV